MTTEYNHINFKKNLELKEVLAHDYKEVLILFSPL